MKSQSKILFYLNNQKIEISDHRSLMSVADFLRQEALLKGTKIVCAEGDCGACTVLIGQPKAKEKTRYQAINSCIYPIFLLNGCHVISVEGVGDQVNPHPMQKAMVDHFGSQCGYCTPGFICSMVGLTESALEKNQKIDPKMTANALTGNLCRCTGYEGIIQAAIQAPVQQQHSLCFKYQNQGRDTELEAVRSKSLYVETETFGIYLPTSLQEALELKSKFSDLRLVGGATDLGVLVNKGKQKYQRVMSLQQMRDLYLIANEKESISIGAQVTIDELENQIGGAFPELKNLLHIFASPQIKRRATLVGNAINASPIADTIPFLTTMMAKVHIESVRGKRVLDINDFYLGYKKLNLEVDEIVTHIEIPKLKPSQKLKLYKASQRKDLDISTVTFAGLIESSQNSILDLRIAIGGVGPVVLRLKDIEKKYIGTKLENNLYEKISHEVTTYINPLSDLRGSKEYRQLLVQNFTKKFFEETFEGTHV